MEPGILNFDTYTRGDKYKGEEEINIKTDGIPNDLTGATIRIMFRDKSGKLLKFITNSSGITITDVVGCKFKIDPFIIDFPPGIIDYDCEITFADGMVDTFLKGIWTIKKGVTYGY